MIFNRIAVMRAERRLSRKDLAAAIGVNYQTIGYLERGEYSPSLELALKLSEYFGVAVEFLFSLRPMEPVSAHWNRRPPEGAASDKEEN
jgi:DNA-binding XRE family transcriptional regulator